MIDPFGILIWLAWAMLGCLAIGGVVALVLAAAIIRYLLQWGWR